MDWEILQTVGAGSTTQRGGLFVHDFVPVDLPFDSVVGAFAHFVNPELLATLAAEAWVAESAEAGRVLHPIEMTSAERPVVDAVLGPPRTRRDALIVPIAWRQSSNRWIPSLDADLEIVAFGPGRTHIHVLGMSALGPATAPCSDRASLEHRLTVATVRHVLVALTETISRRAVSPQEPDAQSSESE